MVSQQRGGDRWGRAGMGAGRRGGPRSGPRGGGGKGGAVASGQEGRGEQPHSRGRQAGAAQGLEEGGGRAQMPAAAAEKRCGNSRGPQTLGCRAWQPLPSVSHPKAGLCATRKKGSRGSPAPSPLSPDSDDAAATPPALLVPGAQGTSGRGGLVSSAAPDTVPVSHASRGGFSGRPHAPL